MKKRAARCRPLWFVSGAPFRCAGQMSLAFIRSSWAFWYRADRA